VLETVFFEKDLTSITWNVLERHLSLYEESDLVRVVAHALFLAN